MSRSQIGTCPNCNHEQLYKGTAKRPRMTCKKCHTRYYLTGSHDSKESKIAIPTSTNKRQFIPPQDENGFIDDPDELLISVAIRELNKPNPDPRWASILLGCKKENVQLRTQRLESFKNLPTTALVNLLSKNLPEEL